MRTLWAALVLLTACQPHELAWWTEQAEELPQSAYDEGCEHNLEGCRTAVERLTAAMPTTTTNTTTVPLPEQDLYESVKGVTYKITIPDEKTEGDCSPEKRAYVWGGNAYEWEHCFRFYSHSYQIGEAEAEALVGRIWAEVEVDGKRSERPAIITNAEQIERSDGRNPSAWYRPSTHSVVFVGDYPVSTMTLLHETAHALATDHPTLDICSRVAAASRNKCVHGDIFRCVAEFLYVHYAGVETSGGCGRHTTTATTVPEPMPEPEVRLFKIGIGDHRGPAWNGDAWTEDIVQQCPVRSCLKVWDMHDDVEGCAVHVRSATRTDIIDSFVRSPNINQRGYWVSGIEFEGTLDVAVVTCYTQSTHQTWTVGSYPDGASEADWDKLGEIEQPVYTIPMT